MFKFFIKTLKVTNDNIILATPLIFFMWLLSLYLGISKSALYSAPALIIFATTILFMVNAFMAGWFYMLQKAITLSKKTFTSETEKVKETFGLFKYFPTGVGKYFLPFLGFITLFLVISSIISFIVYKTGMNFIGRLDIDTQMLKNALMSNENMNAFLNSLTLEELIKLNNWNLLILITTYMFSFLFMFWVPEIIYGTKNPAKALCISVKTLFSDIWNSFKLFIYILILNVVLPLLNAFLGTNPVLYFIILLIYFYFIVYVVVLVFSYYETRFKQEQ